MIDKTDQPKIEEKPAQKTVEPALAPEEAFAKAYEELCAKTGFSWSVRPVWKLRDDNTFSMIIEMSVQANKGN